MTVVLIIVLVIVSLFAVAGFGLAWFVGSALERSTRRLTAARSHIKRLQRDMQIMQRHED